MCGMNQIDALSVSLALSLSKSSPLTASDSHGLSCSGRLAASLVCVSLEDGVSRSSPWPQLGYADVSLSDSESSSDPKHRT